MDKDNESYLDGLLETFGQEPPYETDRRRKATARAKSGKNKTSSSDITVDSLEEEFSLDDLDDSFLDDIDLDDLADPLEDKEYESEVSTGDIPDGNENEDIIPEDTDTVEISESPEDSDGAEETETDEEDPEELPVDEAESQDDTRSEKPGEDAQTVADAEKSSVTGEDETSSEENSVEETEPGNEIGGDFGSDVGTEPEAEPGEELGAELGSEIGEEIGFDEEDEAGEISFDDTEPVEEDNSLPEINPLDDMGEPEVLSDKEIELNKSAKKESSEKKGLLSKIFHKLFANVPLTEEELAAIPTPEQEEEAKKEKEAEAVKKKEDKKAAAEADKKKKAEAAKKKAADNKAKKSAKDAAKKAAKKEAELKRLRAEALEQPEGKINKAGAIIIFLFFIVAAAVVIVGTNIFSYDISIADATYKFGNHKYTEAYEDIRGLKIKEKDMEIHDKIYTVMFVNKQLNSYNNFFAMGDYASALDSLIKGLSRYDKYIALARQLGIHTDLDYVRKQIMAELQSVYGVPEREALELMDMTDKQDYSERIYSIVSKLDTKAIEAGKERRELVP